MKSTTQFLSFIFAAFLTLGASQVMAGEYNSKETNPKFLAEAIAHAEEGIASANAGDAAATLAHITGSLDSLKEINSEANAARIQKAGGKLRVAWGHAKKAVKAAGKDDSAKVKSHLSKIPAVAQKGIDKLKQLHFNN